MAAGLFWMAGLITLAGATVFTLSGHPQRRLAGMAATLVGVLLLLIFWKAPALFCLLFLLAGGSTLVLMLFSLRLFPTGDSLIGPHWIRHVLAAAAIWGFAYSLQQNLSRIPVAAFQTTLLAPDSDSLFASLSGTASGLVVLIVFVFVFSATGIKRLGANHPLGGNDDLGT